MINLICATNESFQIGNSKNNSLLYYIKEDMRRFRWVTEGSYVVMGKNTFLSLPAPLKNRTNVVLTRDTSFTLPDEVKQKYDIIIEHDLEKVLNHYNTGGQHKELFLIGGSNIYAEGIHWADRLFITMIHDKNHPEGDVYFNKSELSEFEITYREKNYDEESGLYYSFINYSRKDDVNE